VIGPGPHCDPFTHRKTNNHRGRAAKHHPRNNRLPSRSWLNLTPAARLSSFFQSLSLRSHSTYQRRFESSPHILRVPRDPTTPRRRRWPLQRRQHGGELPYGLIVECAVSSAGIPPTGHSPRPSPPRTGGFTDANAPSGINSSSCRAHQTSIPPPRPDPRHPTPPSPRRLRRRQTSGHKRCLKKESRPPSLFHVPAQPRCQQTETVIGTADPNISTASYRSHPVQTSNRPAERA